MLLKNKVALITGGASGIGKAVAEHFIAEGAQVAVMDISEERLADFKASYPEHCLTFAGDVTRLCDHQNVLRKTIEQFGKLDVYVSNAGVFDGLIPLEELPEERLDQAFKQLFSVNVKGAFLGAKTVYTELKKMKGNLIFTLSTASFYPSGGGPLYTASKHALLGLLRQLAYEWAPHIRVNGVSPGGTVSNLRAVPVLSDLSKVPADPDVRAKFMVPRYPLKISQQPEDHVAAYALLASEGARVMTGTVIESDGGVGIRGLPMGE